MTRLLDRVPRFIAAATTATLVALVALTTTASPNGAAAQSPSGSGWEAWLGCWRPVEARVVAAPRAPMRCVVPTASPSVVNILTIDSGAVVARDTIDASGVDRRIDVAGCAGTENARWSADNQRVFLHSDLTCAGGVKRTADGIVAITPNGEWLDVQGVRAGTNSGVRVVHYAEANVAPLDLPAELMAFPGTLAGRRMSIGAARVAAGSALQVANVAEAVRRVDTTVVQAWIVERGTRFQLSAQSLVALADAGVPSSVTDVMIGASYPEHFAIDRRPVATGIGEGGSGYGMSRSDSARFVAAYLRDRCGAGGASISMVTGIYDPCRYAYGYRGYSRYMYDDYLFGYGYRTSLYGSYPYGYGVGYYGGGYYSGPIVSVRGAGDEEHGRLVKGRGYTRGDDVTRGSGATPTSSGSQTSGGASSSSGSDAGSSSGASSGRTAHPRPPA